MTTKALKKQLMAAIAMVVVAAIALTSATYAWFVSNTKVTAKAADLTASTAYTLQISKKATASESGSGWGTTHEMSGTHVVTKEESETDGGAYKGLGEGTLVPVSVALKPVSTVAGTGVTTLGFVTDTAWSADATDGKNYAGTFATADTNTYLTDSFQITAAQACRLFMTDDTSITVEGSGNELDKALRLALVVNKAGADASQAKTFIYQLNNNDSTVTSGHYNTSIGSTTTDVDGISKAINTSNTAATITASNLSEAKVKAIAYATAAADANTMLTTTGSADSLYTFAANDIINVTAYVWMEGCDYDCNATASSKYLDKVTVSLAFGAALPE